MKTSCIRIALKKSLHALHINKLKSNGNGEEGTMTGSIQPQGLIMFGQYTSYQVG